MDPAPTPDPSIHPDLRTDHPASAADGPVVGVNVHDQTLLQHSAPNSAFDHDLQDYVGPHHHHHLHHHHSHDGFVDDPSDQVDDDGVHHLAHHHAPEQASFQPFETDLLASSTDPNGGEGFPSQAEIHAQQQADFAELLSQHGHGGPAEFALEETVGGGAQGGGAGGVDDDGGAYAHQQEMLLIGGQASSSGARPDQEGDDQMGGGHHHHHHHHHHQGEDGHQRAESSAMGRKRKKAQTTVPTQDGAGDEDGEAKKMREQVRNACTNCQKSRKKCSGERPCQNCVRHNAAEPCVDSARKKRPVGIKRGKYKTKNKKGEQESEDAQAHADGEGAYQDGHSHPHDPQQQQHHAHSSLSSDYPHAGQQAEEDYSVYTRHGDGDGEGEETIDPSLNPSGSGRAGEEEYVLEHHQDGMGRGGGAGLEGRDEGAGGEYEIIDRQQEGAGVVGAEAGIAGGGGLLPLSLPSDHLPPSPHPPAQQTAAGSQAFSDFQQTLDSIGLDRINPDHAEALRVLLSKGREGEMFESIPGQTGADDEEYEVIPDDELHHDDDQRATAHDHADEDDVEGHV